MVKLQFKKEMRLVQQAVRKDDDIAPVIRAQRPAWQKLYTQLYLSVGADFAGRTRGKLKATSPSTVKASEDVWQRLVLEYLRQTSGSKITGISTTTLDLVRQALAEGTAAVEGIDQLSKRVQQTYELFTPYRGELISRTEVVCASERGSISMARSTGLSLDKSWLTTRDGRERDWHADADGQTVGLDEAFTVNGEELDHPGDTSRGASAGNIIQCRCTALYNVAG